MIQTSKCWITIALAYECKTLELNLQWNEITYGKILTYWIKFCTQNKNQSYPIAGDYFVYSYNVPYVGVWHLNIHKISIIRIRKQMAIRTLPIKKHIQIMQRKNDVNWNSF